MVRTDRASSMIIPRSVIKEHLAAAEQATLVQPSSSKTTKQLPTILHQKANEIPPNNTNQEDDSHYEDVTEIDLPQQLKTTQDQTQQVTGKKRNSATAKTIRVTEATKKKTLKNLELAQEFIPQQQPEYLTLGRGRPPQTHNTYRSVFT